jgi:hypothetical protein
MIYIHYIDLKALCLTKTICSSAVANTQKDCKIYKCPTYLF